ncbi:hypothetical protein Anapl_09457 [Anas platyrhynchos]|uniref:Uncharacterized protein n=1 Tax=Anas platyrhynchos TaxID=8839 RepID=R0LQ93_ANAPL|nr:hypothetical protein Anapl_09457 [Anas platyrhynchos]
MSKALTQTVQVLQIHLTYCHRDVLRKPVKDPWSTVLTQPQGLAAAGCEIIALFLQRLVCCRVRGETPPPQWLGAQGWPHRSQEKHSGHPREAWEVHITSSASCKDYCMVPPRSVPEVSCIGLQWFLLGQLHRKTCDGNDNGDECSPNSPKFRLWLQTLRRFWGRQEKRSYREYLQYFEGNRAIGPYNITGVSSQSVTLEEAGYRLQFQAGNKKEVPHVGKLCRAARPHSALRFSGEPRGAASAREVRAGQTPVLTGHCKSPAQASCTNKRRQCGHWNILRRGQDTPHGFYRMCQGKENAREELAWMQMSEWPGYGWLGVAGQSELLHTGRAETTSAYGLINQPSFKTCGSMVCVYTAEKNEKKQGYIYVPIKELTSIHQKEKPPSTVLGASKGQGEHLQDAGRGTGRSRKPLGHTASPWDNTCTAMHRKHCDRACPMGADHVPSAASSSSAGIQLLAPLVLASLMPPSVLDHPVG